MGFLKQFYVGRAGEEKAIVSPVTDLNIQVREIEQVHKNLQGDIRRGVVKINTPIFGLTWTNVPVATLNYLVGLKSRGRNLLSLKMNDAWTMPDEENTTTDTTHLTLTNTSARNITITGVFLDTDPNHTGTNFFTGGSFVEATRVVTLGTPVASANTNVLVAYTFRSHKVYLRSLRPRPLRGVAADRYLVAAEFEGA